MTLPAISLNRLIILFTLLAAACLQIQIDLFSTPSYPGLRINATDFLLPVSGLLILISILIKKSLFPRFKISGVYLWFASITVILLIALYRGMIHQGELPHWGFYNKVLGWFILMAYFSWGAWLAANATEKTVLYFFKIFIAFSCIVSAIGSSIIVLQDFNLIPLTVPYPYPGFMANRNAFGLLVLCATVMLFIFQRGSTPLFSSNFERIFWFILPLAQIEIGSRSGWIVWALQMAVFIYMDRKYFAKKILPFLGAGIFLVTALWSVHPNFIFKQNQNKQFAAIFGLLRDFNNISDEEIQGKVFKYRTSDLMRITVGKLAIELWTEAPVLGAGLGTVQYEEPRRLHVYLDLVDCTPIWILSETGIVGFIIFSGFFGCVFFRLRHEIKETDSKTARMMMGILMTFAVMCVLHEILYTRFLWFFLGLTLAAPNLLGKVRDQEPAPVVS